MSDEASMGPRTCAEVQAAFSDWVDDALAADARAAMAAHLGECAACRDGLAAFGRTVALLRGAEPIRAPAGFVDRVLVAARPASWPRRLARRLFLPWPVKLPLEVAAVALVAVSAVWLYERTPAVRQELTGAPPVPPPAASVTAVPPAAPGPPGAPVEPRARKSAPPSPGPRATRPGTPPGAPPPARESSTPEPRPGRPAPPAPAPPASGPAVAPPGPAPEGPAPAAAPTTRPQGMEERAKGAPAAAGAAASRQEKATAPAPALGTLRAARDAGAADVAGRLTVADRQTAAQAVEALATRLGGSGTPRARADAGGPVVVEVRVPREAYPELVSGLARLGAWIPERVADPLPDEVRVHVAVD